MTPPGTGPQAVAAHYGATCRYHATAADGPVVSWQGEYGTVRATWRLVLVDGHWPLTDRRRAADFADLILLADECRSHLARDRGELSVRRLLDKLREEDDRRHGPAV